MDSEFDRLKNIVDKLRPQERPPERRNVARAQARKIAKAREVFRRLHKLRMEGLRLYRCMPSAKGFHESLFKWRVLDGSNQSTKTTTAAAEMAMALTGTHPTANYPKTNGKAIAVGLDWPHVGDPMWVKLGEQGAFKIIRDEHTGLWRSIRPHPDDPTVLDPYDLAYMEKWRDAPPLLPPRLIEHISWENPSARRPRLVIMKNGWRLEFRSSEGKEAQGKVYDAGWIDEQLLRGEHYKEMTRGLMARQGRGWWSATPQNCNPELQELRERADAGDEFVEGYLLLLDDNFAILPEEKLAFRKGLTPEEVAIRYFGEYALVGRRIYGMYNPMGEHGCEPFEIPDDWTRYLVVDPARQYLGTLLAAVDPQEKHCTVYDGFVLRSANKTKWAERIAELEGGVRFEYAICDFRMGRTRDIGGDGEETVAEQYFKALTEAGVVPYKRGPLHGFFPGSDDVLAREESLIGWMTTRSDGPFAGTPYLQVMRGVFQDLDRQIKNAQYQLDKPKKRKDLQEDALDCLEYLAAANPYYQSPKAAEEGASDPVWDAFKAKEKRAKKKRRRQPRGTTI